MSSAKFIRSNILITFLSLVGVGVNFISQMILAYYFGARAERDAYFSAMAVPTYVVTLFVGSLSVIFLPYYVDLRKKNPDSEVIKFVSSTFGACIVFLSLITILCFSLSNKIIFWIAPGYSPEQLELTGSLFRILIFTVIFQSLSSLVTVFHHVDNRFLWPAISPIVMPLTSLLFVVLFHDYGILSLALGVLTGSVLSLMVLLPYALKNIRINYVTSLLNPNTSRVLRLALPLLASGAIYRLTTILERIIASRLPSGSISFLGYSNQLYLLLATIASGSIVTTFYPIMSAAWAEGNHVEFKEILSSGIKLILLITFPIAAIFIALGSPIIEILFQRGAFDSSATQAVASSLALLMGAFIFGSLGNIMFKVFYITNKAFFVSIIAISEVIVYTIMAYILSAFYSYLGLALALTISSGFTLCVAVFFLLRWNYLSLSVLVGDIIKLLIGALACGYIAYFIFNLVKLPNIVITTGLSVLMGIIIYFITILYLLKISHAAAINKAVKSYF